MIDGGTVSALLERDDRLCAILETGFNIPRAGQIRQRLPCNIGIEITTDDDDILRIAASPFEPKTVHDRGLDAAPVVCRGESLPRRWPAALQRPLGEQGIQPGARRSVGILIERDVDTPGASLFDQS